MNDATRFRLDQVIGRWRQAFATGEPALLTPTAMLGVLTPLTILTARVVEVNQRQSRERSQLDLDLARWRTRLDFYTGEVNTALSAGLATDPAVVLDTVFAPLFFGRFGQNGAEIPTEGFAAGTSFEEPRLPDIGTPYTLANQLGEALRGIQENTLQRAASESLDDLAREARKLPGVVASRFPWLAVGLAGVGVVALLRLTR